MLTMQFTVKCSDQKNISWITLIYLHYKFKSKLASNLKAILA